MFERRRESRRFRVNPLELLLFLGMIGVTSRSAYLMFSEIPNYDAFLHADRAPASAVDEASPARRKLTGHLFLDCTPSVEPKYVEAEQVRVHGDLCGSRVERGSTGPAATPQKVSVLNRTNQQEAIVFIDKGRSEYSTEFLPLDPGKNAIQIKIEYQNGKVVDSLRDVYREPANQN